MYGRLDKEHRVFETSVFFEIEENFVVTVEPKKLFLSSNIPIHVKLNFSEESRNFFSLHSFRKFRKFQKFGKHYPSLKYFSNKTVLKTELPNSDDYY